MIMCVLYEGDGNDDLIEIQHEVYDIAIRTMGVAANRFSRFSSIVLRPYISQARPVYERCDHRTLQYAHDLLAAAWRFVVDEPEPRLPFDGPPKKLTSCDWITWLEDEMRGWIDYPNLAHFLVEILEHQNKPLGYLAEAQLCLGLLDRFPYIPWRRDQRDTFEKDIARALQEKHAKTRPLAMLG